MELQGVETIQVDWQPPAGGNLQLLEALDFFQENEKVEKANQESIQRIKDAHPFLIDIGLAIDVIPGMHSKKYYMLALLLHGKTWRVRCRGQ